MLLTTNDLWSLLKSDLEDKNKQLLEMANNNKNEAEQIRLKGKAEGVRLAIGSMYSLERLLSD